MILMVEEQLVRELLTLLEAGYTPGRLHEIVDAAVKLDAEGGERG